jgi:hypothetical protein
LSYQSPSETCGLKSARFFSYQLSVISYQNLAIQYIQGQQIYLTNYRNSNGMGNGAYVAFGRSLGDMDGQWRDVHGAGSQRSDPKSGNPANYPTGFGPQGDAIRINNYVRLVPGGISEMVYIHPKKPSRHVLV